MLIRSPRVVAVVLNFDAPDDTVACVAALRRGTALDLEIVIVDNGSDSAAFDRLMGEVGPRVQGIATGANLGYAAGNNVGIEWALTRRPDFIWVLNPDSEPETDTLQQLLVAADEVPDAGVLGPRILQVDPAGISRIWSDGGTVDPTRFGATGHRSSGLLPEDVPATTPHDVGYVTGASMLLRRTMVESVGLLPEDYFLYFEETEYCLRVQRAGWRTVVDTRASMTHHKRSSGDLPTPYYLYYMTRNRLHFARAHFGASIEQALPDFEASFLTPWRARVARLAPAWLGSFDHLVELAVHDARTGSLGRQPAVETVPRPVLAGGAA